jgi:hypothetical protein
MGNVQWPFLRHVFPALLLDDSAVKILPDCSGG